MPQHGFKARLNHSMTRSRRHHFLPVFYLKAWTSLPNRIHLYDIKAATARKDVGLRRQGQEHLYYRDQRGEDALKTLDNCFAKVCNQIRETQTLPDLSTDPESFVALSMFVVTQHARTPPQAEDIRQSYAQIIPRALDAMGAPSGDTHIKYDFPQLEAVRLAAAVQLETMDDLVPHLITAHGNSFLTSDNPAFFYNQLCQGINGATAAVDNHGFQAFCPISPSAVVMLFDPSSYELTSVASKATKRSEATEADIQQLNMIQALSATQNLYANDPRLLEQAPAIIRSVSAQRETKGPQLAEYNSTEPGDPSKLFVQHNPMPNLSLDLSFLRLKWSAATRPSWWKLHDYRHAPNKMPQLLRDGAPIKTFADPNDPTVTHAVADFRSTR